MKQKEIITMQQQKQTFWILYTCMKR